MLQYFTMSSDTSFLVEEVQCVTVSFFLSSEPAPQVNQTTRCDSYHVLIPHLTRLTPQLSSYQILKATENSYLPKSGSLCSLPAVQTYSGTHCINSENSLLPFHAAKTPSTIPMNLSDVSTDFYHSLSEDSACCVDDHAPTHGWSEYLSIAYQSSMFLVGMPLNLLALRKIVLMIRKSRDLPRIVLFKLHLTITDIMIFLFYSVSEVLWITTFSWHAGNLMCKLVKFLQLLSFTVHSNVVTAIGLDRLFSVKRMRNVTVSNTRRNAQIMLGVCWTLGVLVSVPQFLVWTVDTPFPQFPQCSTIWAFEEHFTNGTKAPESSVLETFYNVSHLLVVFWIPAVLLILCYAFIFLSLIRYSKHQKRLRTSRNRDTSLDQTGGIGEHRRFSRQYSPGALVVGPFGGLSAVQEVPTPSQSFVPLPSSPNDMEITCQFPPRTRTTSVINNSMQRTHEVASMRSSQRSTSKQSSSSSNVSKTFRWTRHIRSRTLRQTILIAIAYILCWSPYNVLALWKQIDKPGWTAGGYDEYLGFLYGPIILNAVIDPLLYQAAKGRS